MSSPFTDLHAALKQGDPARLDAAILAFGKAAHLLHVAGLLGFKYGWEHSAPLIAALVRNKVPFPEGSVLGDAQALARASDEGLDAAVKALKQVGEPGAAYVATVLDLLGREEQAEVLRRALGLYLLLHAPRTVLDKVLGAGA